MLSLPPRTLMNALTITLFSAAITGCGVEGDASQQIEQPGQEQEGPASLMLGARDGFEPEELEPVEAQDSRPALTINDRDEVPEQLELLDTPNDVDGPDLFDLMRARCAELAGDKGTMRDADVDQLRAPGPNGDHPAFETIDEEALGGADLDELIADRDTGAEDEAMVADRLLLDDEMPAACSFLMDDAIDG